MENERWAAFPKMEGLYEISTMGRVMSLKRTDELGRRLPSKIMSNARLSGRYVRIRLRNKGVQIEKCIHLAVLEAFVGQRPENMQACHNDGNRLNNCLENLRWDTCKNNQLDKIKHNTIARGSKNGSSKLKDFQVLEIRRLLTNGGCLRCLSRKYGVSGTQISRIRDGKVWKWLKA